jgi:UDP-N-acetylmuramoyl-L-alanyl-D-glutamate--2,6-diaminopimelate ligase
LRERRSPLLRLAQREPPPQAGIAGEVRLDELKQEIGAIDARGNLGAEARDVTHDSRECRPGGVFVAIRGENFDGHRYIGQAVELGVVAVISELALGAFSSTAALVPAWIQVPNARAALARAGAAIHGHPSRRLKLVGITGTNGKTTTAHLIDAITRAAEGTSAMFGTINYRIGDQSSTAHHTTPEAADIQRMLAQAVEAGCRSAVMEVSSHAIELHRADSLKFEVAVFTNLTRDHLDYHKTMESYFAAKERLFTSLDAIPETAVLNVDDEYGRRLLKSARSKSIVTYGLTSTADVYASGAYFSAEGLKFEAATPAGAIEVVSRLVGRPHVYNLLAAISAGLALGFDPAEIARGIRECPVVPGRFEQVIANGLPGSSFTVIVDYAHTDDALKNVLQTAREVAGDRGRVITVFGCGGDRDRTKRAPMGEIAATMSDIAIVTSDNPRSEDPNAIIEDVEVGLKRAGRAYLKQADRRLAIFEAVSKARAGDVVMIAGKGHEPYQIIGDKTIHFDDREVAREALKNLK